MKYNRGQLNFMSFPCCYTFKMTKNIKFEENIMHITDLEQKNVTYEVAGPLDLNLNAAKEGEKDRHQLTWDSLSFFSNIY